MLQQTQVTTVIPYYEQFHEALPQRSRARRRRDRRRAAPLDGARLLRAGPQPAQGGAPDHDGATAASCPGPAELLEELPGIGRSTAAAITAIAHQVRAPILDGNVKRVLARFHAVAGYPGETTVARALWALADEHTPEVRVADYTQAIMDLGATVCLRSNPRCDVCPVRSRCAAFDAGSTDRYPGRKPKKEKPVRRARLFVVHDGRGTCLLEQRPANGVWGGLWTPPERPIDTSLQGFLCELGLTETGLQGKPMWHRASGTRSPTFTSTSSRFTSALPGRR